MLTREMRRVGPMGRKAANLVESALADGNRTADATSDWLSWLFGGMRSGEPTQRRLQGRTVFRRQSYHEFELCRLGQVFRVDSARNLTSYRAAEILRHNADYELLGFQ